MIIDPRLHRIVSAHPYPLLFATISGAPRYGFASPDSDFDLRGAHVLPLEKVVGLQVRDETVQDQLRTSNSYGCLVLNTARIMFVDQGEPGAGQTTR